MNGLPNLPNEKPSYHYHAFDWGPTALNDETKMMDYKTASWAAEQLRTRDFEGKPFFMAIGISKPHLTWYVPQKYFDMYPLHQIVLPETLATDLDDILDVPFPDQAPGPVADLLHLVNWNLVTAADFFTTRKEIPASVPSFLASATELGQLVATTMEHKTTPDRRRAAVIWIE